MSVTENVTGLGNQNATQHGLFTVADNPLLLALTRLPAGSKTIREKATAFREFLFQAVQPAAGDDLGKALIRSALIDTAVKWALVSELANRWLGQRFTKMSDSDRLSYLKMIAVAAERRDAALRGLNLDTREPSIADILYGPRPQQDLTQPPAVCHDAGVEGAVGDCSEASP